jgi:hypothetical protein
LYFRLGITPNNPTGTRWKAFIAPLLKHVSAGANFAIWGLSLANNIYCFTGRFIF